MASFEEGVCCLAVRLDRGNLDMAIAVLENTGLRHYLGAILECCMEHGIDIIDLKRDIFHSVTVLLDVVVNFPQLSLLLCSKALNLVLRAKRRRENEGDVAVADYMRADGPTASLQATIGDSPESHASNVIACRLLGVPNEPVYMVIAAVASEGGSPAGWRGRA